MEPIVIPENKKYTLCFLDSNGLPKQFIVFGGTSKPMSEDEIKLHLFRDDKQRIEIDLLDTQPTFYHSSQQLHADDSIRTIKKKIIHEIGANELCYEEIYLFSIKKERVSLLAAYQQMNNHPPTIKAQTRLERQLQELENISNNLDKRTLGQFLFNLKVDNPHDIGEDAVTYEDLLKIMPKEDEYKVSIPIGQRFSRNHQWLFSGNPTDILTGDGEPVYRRSKKDDLYVFENQLLMSYGEIENKIIYVCLAKDVLEYANKMTIDQEYMVDLYFPLLYKKGIKNMDMFMESHQNLIDQTKQLLKPTTYQSFDTIDSFYDIYYNRLSELPYLDRGIESFDIIIHPDYDVPIPLDIIFKQIHATKQMPFIKYNPGLRRENVFRLYSEEIAKNGKKIPFLKKSQIYAISKLTGKLRQISLFIRHETTREIVDLYIDFEYNGNIRIRGNLKKAITVNDLETIIYNAVNPLLLSINQFLERSGYSFNMFDKLLDRNIEVLQLEYVCKINMKKTMKLKSFLGCLINLFDINDPEFDLSKQINMQFIRVDNYTKMNAISIMINDLFRKTNSQEEIVNTLMVNFALDRDAALKEVVDFFNSHIRIQGQYVNKSVDIADNPGFPLTMNKSPFDDKLIVKVGKVNSVNFIEVLHIYLDTILRLTQYPDTINPELFKKMQKLCSKRVDKPIEENVVENVINVRNVIGLAAAPIFLEDEEDEQDDDDKFLPEDEEEGAEQEEDVEAEQEVEEVEEEVEEEAEEEEAEAEEEVEEEEEVEVEVEEKTVEEEAEQTVKSSSSESDRFLPSDSSSENLPTSSTGGARKKSETTAPPEPKKEKSNIFTKRIKEREPTLILTKKQGKFSSYSRICPANVSLQPVILTDEEKKRIDEEHPGSYTNALQYGTDPKNPYWYICPRYWCLKSNSPMTEEEVAKGECGGKIIPDNAKAPPPGHFIYEFTDDKYHKNEKGEYIYHSPGFKPEHSHPDKLCLPCCYNKWSSYNMKNPIEQQKRRQQCGLVDHYVYTDDQATGEPVQKLGPDGKPMQYAVYGSTEFLDETGKKSKKKEAIDPEKQKKKINVFGVERIPIPQYRWGFLPLSIELFLHTDNSKFVVKNNPALIQPHKRPLLRFGVETSQHQSFVAVLADIYSYYHNSPVPSVSEMRTILTEKITLDIYLQLHNGSLVSIFKPNRLKVDDMTVEKYSNTEFYKSIQLSVPAQYSFLQDTVSSYENFLAYLKDDDSMIDHTYLWDVVSSSGSPLFTSGLNMMILRIYDNDVTDNVELLCPTMAYSSNIYVKGRGTILLLLHNGFYEPIYLYGDNDKEYPIPPVKIFTQNAGTLELKQMQKIFELVSDTMSKSCKPIRVRPRVYEYKENISAEELSKIVIESGFSITSQIISYRGKVIGLMVMPREEAEKPLFIPCFPSSILPKIQKVYLDAVEWYDYVKTRDQLNQISSRTSGKIRCKPLLKVVEDGLIVGILTETNQFVFIDPPVENLVEDGIPVLNTVGYKDREYFKKDDAFAVSKGFDEIRVNTVRSVALETQFYTSFRSILRNLLNDYLNREVRQSVVDILDDPQNLYTVKVKKIENLLRTLSKQSIRFVDDVDADVKNALAKTVDCTTNCGVRSYCLMEKNKMCVPKKHLVSGQDNESLYFKRAADELVRYKRIQLFMLEPRRYLNITNVELSVNDDEVLLLASVLNDPYFDSLESYNQNKYVKRITYENAEQSRTNPFYQHFTHLPI
jgi:hypothetical protein